MRSRVRSTDESEGILMARTVTYFRRGLALQLSSGIGPNAPEIRTSTQSSAPITRTIHKHCGDVDSVSSPSVDRRARLTLCLRTLVLTLLGAGVKGLNGVKAGRRVALRGTRLLVSIRTTLRSTPPRANRWLA